MKKTAFCLVVAAALAFMLTETGSASVMEEEGRTYIVDRTGERWDVSQAVSLGFKPEKFQYGLGRDAFTTLDDSLLGPDTAGVPSDLRVIGISEDPEAKAYSVRKLSRHEVANSMLAQEPVAVAY
jgi:hypothetical protein